MSNKTILGVGLMIVGAILFDGALLRYELAWLAPNATACGFGVDYYVSMAVMFIGLGIAIYGVRKK